MKSKFLNLIALAAIAMCFATVALAKTENVQPENFVSNVSVQSKAAPVKSPAIKTETQMFVSATNDSRSDAEIAVAAIEREYQSTQTQSEPKIFGDAITDWRDIDRRFQISGRANNFRPPNTTDQPRLTISKCPDERILKRTFDAVIRNRLRT